jgi:hypothetical protein
MDGRQGRTAAGRAGAGRPASAPRSPQGMDRSPPRDATSATNRSPCWARSSSTCPPPSASGTSRSCARRPSGHWTRATTARSATWSSNGGERHGWKTRAGVLAAAEASGRGGPLGPVVPRPGPRRRRGRRGAAPLSRRRYRIEQSPEFAETAARLSPKAKRWLSELYQILTVTPLPGQSDLDIQPHPWVPNIAPQARWPRFAT